MSHNKTIDQVLSDHGAEPGELTYALKAELTQMVKEALGMAMMDPKEYDSQKLKAYAEGSNAKTRQAIERFKAMGFDL